MVSEITNNDDVTMPASSVSCQLNKNDELESSTVRPLPWNPSISVTKNGVVNIIGNNIENHYVIKKTAVTVGTNQNPETCTSTVAEKWRNFVFGDRRKKIYTAVFITTCLLIGAVVMTAVLTSSVHHEMKDDEAPLPNNFSGRFISREYWFASPPRGTLYPFPELPLSLVFVENPRGYQCTEPKYCPGMLKYMQNAHFTMGMLDIGYNFVIADDGYIYEGRGWNIVGNFTGNYDDRSYGVAFLGNYGLIPMPKRQITAFNILMKEGVERGKLTLNYKFCPNPIMLTYKKYPLFFLQEIQKWDHFVSNFSISLVNS